MIELNSKNIGKVIRRLRKDCGQSQEICSGLAGIARSHLAMIENSTKIPNLETLWKLSFAFNMLPHELIKLIEEEHK